MEATPGNACPRYTLLAALTTHGVQAPWLLEGAMDGAAFAVYVEHVLVPTLRPGDVVLMDNLSFHKAPRVRRLIESVGARLEFLPPYAPDLNPIELCWSKIKTALRARKARTFSALLDALDEAFGSVTKQDAKAWFAHCGYEKPKINLQLALIKPTLCIGNHFQRAIRQAIKHLRDCFVT